MNLPKRRGDEISHRTLPDVEPPDNEFERIDPMGLSSWNMDVPDEYSRKIEYDPAIDAMKDRIESSLKRKKVIRTIYNIGVSVGARLTGVPELKKLRITMPKRVKPYLKQKSTWEGVAAVLGAVGVTIYPDAIVEIITGVLVVVGGIEMWKRESEDE